MRSECAFLSTLLLVGLLGGQSVAQRDERGGEEKLPVKARTQFGSGNSNVLSGVVSKIDKDSMTVCEKDGRTGKETSYQFYALDLHKEGKYLEQATAPGSYLWSDVKKGDTIDVFTVRDKAEDKEYAINFCIQRRPGAKLPKSQRPDEDGRFATASMANDILNGEDVSEEDIIKVFPPEFDRKTGLLKNPGGLPPEYRAKLNENRDKKEAEKKEKELKAKPPEKKDDKK